MYKQPSLWLGGYPRRTSQGIRIESNVIPSHQRLMHIHINNFPAGIFINLFRELKQWLCQFRLISDTECLHRCCCVTVMFSKDVVTASTMPVQRICHCCMAVKQNTFARIEVSYSANVIYSKTACHWPGSNIFTSKDENVTTRPATSCS